MSKETHYVEKILSRRPSESRRGAYEYEVLWQGFSPDETTWEHKKSLPAHLVNEFNKRQKITTTERESANFLATFAQDVSTLNRQKPKSQGPSIASPRRPARSRPHVDNVDVTHSAPPIRGRQGYRQPYQPILEVEEEDRFLSDPYAPPRPMAREYTSSITLRRTQAMDFFAEHMARQSESQMMDRYRSTVWRPAMSHLRHEVYHLVQVLILLNAGDQHGAYRYLAARVASLYDTNARNGWDAALALMPTPDQAYAPVRGTDLMNDLACLYIRRDSALKKLADASPP